jgi:hypothetical protein
MMVVLPSLWRDILLPSCGARSGRSGHARGHWHAKQLLLLELELLLELLRDLQLLLELLRDLLLRVREYKLGLGLARCLGWARGGEHDRDEIRLRLARHLVLLLLFLRRTHQQVMRRRA